MRLLIGRQQEIQCAVGEDDTETERGPGSILLEHHDVVTRVTTLA